ncbi:MAG: L,D-transpeptidase [Methylococcales bacterium]|nr:L,D-transpeptidase [Methylococcales bacterium]
MRQLELFFFILLINIVFSLPIFANEEIWLLIDTTKLNLEIKKGDKTLVVMKNIAIGRNGAGIKLREGDDVTPIGTYKITWVNEESIYRRFYGLDYPLISHADIALQKGLLKNEQYLKIVDAHRKDQLPLQNTMMGGNIGIHGLGAADEAIHKLLNWTHGCIALTNEQIDNLAPWISKGIRVEIK